MAGAEAGEAWFSQPCPWTAMSQTLCGYLKVLGVFQGSIVALEVLADETSRQEAITTYESNIDYV